LVGLLRVKLNINTAYCGSLCAIGLLIAVRRRHGVGAAGRRSKRICRGAAWRGRLKEFVQRFPKKFRSILKISDDLFLVIENRKLQQNNYAVTMALATRRHIIGGGGAPINKGGGAHKLATARRGRPPALDLMRNRSISVLKFEL